MTTHSTPLAVVGAGPGGYAAAFFAADLGIEVTLVDAEPNPGGVCLYRGCIPSKALLHVAKVIDEGRQAAAWGVEFSRPKIDLDKMRSWKDAVVGKLTAGLGQLATQRNVRYIQGLAKIADAHTLVVEGGGGSQRISFQQAILATGSRPASVPGLSIESPGVIDSTGALEIRDVPKSLLVVGGGYIGLEIGSVYAALGSKVSIVEMTPGLLPGADRDLVSPLAKRLEKICERVMLGAKVVQMKEAASGIRVTIESAVRPAQGASSSSSGAGAGGAEQVFEKVLIAVGRRPSSDIPGLDRTGVTLDHRGFVIVDPQRRTAEPNIFAIGDLVGEPMLAHKASHEARVAVDAIAGRQVAFDPRAIPAVVFTDPEIAWCGLTEAQAKAEGRAVEVARFPWGASGRAMTLDRTDGVTKLVLEPDTDRVLGVGIAGPGAGELIAEGVVAIEMGASASDLALSIHPHPTLSETLMESAEVFFGHSTHLYRPKKR